TPSASSMSCTASESIRLKSTSMASLIKERRIAADSWQRLKPDEHGTLPPLPESGDVIVPLALWLERRAVLLARPGRLGLWLDSHEHAQAISADVQRF